MAGKSIHDGRNRRGPGTGRSRVSKLRSVGVGAQLRATDTEASGGSADSAVGKEHQVVVAPAPPAVTVVGARRQLHLRLFPEDDARLRQLAAARGQTLSAAVRYLVLKEGMSLRSLPRPPGLMVRRRGRARISEEHLTEVARALGPSVVMGRVQSGTEIYRERIATQRQQTVMVVLLGGIALFIALVGVVSVTSYATARRAKEIGVRLAFGAGHRDVVRLMMWDSILPALGGIAAGLALAALYTRVLKSFLFGTAPTDPLAFSGVALTTAAAVALATWIPARRAAEVDPAELLRGD